MNPTLIRCGLLFLLATWIGATRSAICHAEIVEVFVWNQGDDSHDGSRSAPLQTVEAALAKVRGNDKPSIISIAPGVYRIGKPIKMDAKDSRTAEAPLLIRKLGNRGEAIFISAAVLPNDQWRRPTREDRLAAFLPGEAKRNVLVMDLAGDPVTSSFIHQADFEKRESQATLGWDGHLLQRSRWPNKGYAYVKEVLEKGPTSRWLKKGEPPPTYSFEQPTGGSFTVREPLDFKRVAAEFALTRDIRVEGYLSNDWDFQIEPLGSVDPAQGALQLVRYTRYGIIDERKLARRFSLRGVISYLDQPGEWSYDDEKQKLYLWPVQPPVKGVPGVQVLGKTGLIEAHDVSHVTVERLTFEGFGDTAVRFHGANHVTIAGCEFRAAGGTSVRVDNGMHNTVRSCDIHDVRSGIVMAGVRANRKTLTSDHNRVINNHLWNIASRRYGGAVAMSGVGGYFAHNLLHDMQCGLRYGDNDFVAEYNEFYRMGFEMGDWNPCYNGANLSLWNNTFRYNFFHHLIETPGAHPIAAIRADDGASGLQVESNVFYKTGTAAVQFHGPGSSVVNNFVMHTSRLLWSVQGPYEKISKDEFMRKKREEMEKTQAEVEAGTRRFQDKQNILGKAESVFGKEGWKNNSIWINKYPHFANCFDLQDHAHSPWVQSFALVKDNYMDDSGGAMPFHFHGHNPSKTADEVRKFLPDSADIRKPYRIDPSRVFVGPTQLDFRFRGSQLKGGGKKFDFEKVGLVADRYRRKLPDKEAYRKEVVTQFRNDQGGRGTPDLDAINRRYRLPEYLKSAKR